MKGNIVSGFYFEKNYF